MRAENVRVVACMLLQVDTGGLRQRRPRDRGHGAERGAVTPTRFARGCDKSSSGLVLYEKRYEILAAVYKRLLIIIPLFRTSIVGVFRAPLDPRPSPSPCLGIPQERF